MSALLVIVGIALLYFGGELLVENSIRLAKAFGVSSLVIGLTVVAFATSAPELAATLTAAFKGAPEMAIGNVLGSNVANLGLILGVSAIIFPLYATVRFIRREVAFMVFVTIVIYPLMATGLHLSRLEGLLLVGLLGVFIATQMRETGTESETADEEAEGEAAGERPVWLSLLGVAVGVGLLVGGAYALVEGASTIARSLGVSDRVIGLTLVALGTSLPELAAAIAAARRHEGDLVLGNVIGSNIFNLLCILGFTSLAHPIDVPAKALALDFWVVLAISVLVLIALATQRRLVRFEGAILLALYLGYMIFLYWAKG
ncbi:MAG: calcium/sodium antiporter [bacterium]|nr:calcium/sodium antiporter [bacterium]